MKHVRLTHTGCEKIVCNICDLYTCSVCRGAEGSLPTDCPGRLMSEVESNNVYNGFIDYREGRGWVDPDGTGTSMGDQAIKYPSPKKFARVLIFNNRREVLIIHTIKQGRNRWEFPGGKIDKEDSSAASAGIRETFEEVGVKVAECYLLTERDICIDGFKWHGFFFVATRWTGLPENKEPEKANQFRWVGFNEYADLPCIPSLSTEILRTADQTGEFVKGL